MKKQGVIILIIIVALLIIVGWVAYLQKSRYQAVKIDQSMNGSTERAMNKDSKLPPLPVPPVSDNSDEETVFEASQAVGADTSLDTIGQELDGTMILEEDFSDL